MQIEGLDYNTQREKLTLPEYGREIQKMVEYAMTQPTKQQRQQCANTIVATMERMYPGNHANADYKQKLWDHLAIISHFELDIDWPYDIKTAHSVETKPTPMEYPMQRIPVRHYGKMVFELFNKLKTMSPGKERDRLTQLTANQMKRCLCQWSHGSSDDEKVASDLANFTDGKIQLDLSKFKFEKIDTREFTTEKKRSNRKK